MHIAASAAEFGIDVLAGAKRSTVQLALPPVAEQVGPVVQIVPMQLLALEMAVARGHDPDAPRGLAKITLTR